MQRQITMIINRIVSRVILFLCLFLLGTELVHAQSVIESPLLLFPASPSLLSDAVAVADTEGAQQEMLQRLAEQAAALQQQGLLQAYTIQPDLGAIRLVGATPAALTLLRKASPLPLTALPEEAVTRSLARQQRLSWRRANQQAGVQPPTLSLLRAAQSGQPTPPLVRAGLFLDENQVQIYGNAVNTPVTIRLFDSSNGLKAETTITTNADGFAAAQLNATVRTGDLVFVQASGQSPMQTTVPRLVIELDKATDTVRGEGPAKQPLEFFVQAWRTNDWRSYQTALTTADNGRYQLAIGAQWDLRMADSGAVVSSSEYFDVYRNFTVSGYWVNLTENHVGGIGLPAGATVKAVLYNSTGTMLAEGQGQVDSDGALYIGEFTGCMRESSNIAAGHSVIFQIAGQAAVTVKLPPLTLSIAAANDTLTGSAPAQAKLSGKVWLSSGAEFPTDIDTFRADGSGNFSATFAGRFDIQAGDWGEVHYHDAQDNQVSVTVRTPGLLSANLTDDAVDLSGNPNQAATITLRNALGAVKALTTATMDEMGAGDVSFYDPAGNLIDLVAGDTLQATGAGLNESYALAPLTVLANRTTRTVTGRAQPQTTLVVEVGYANRSKTVTTDASGNYAVTVDTMVGGDRVRVAQRAGAGRETLVQIYAPQITVSPWSTTDTYVYGYAAPQQTVAVTIIAHASGSVKARRLTQADQRGRYSVDLDAGVQLLDRVTVQSGNLQSEWTMSAVNFQVNGATNLLTGQAAPQASLILSLWRSVDGFGWYYSKQLTADGNGNFATDFGGIDFWPGDEFTVYYQSEQRDQQRQIKALPNLEVDQSRNQVYARGEPGVPVKLILRDAQGTLLSTTTFTPTNAYQWISTFFNAQSNAPHALVPGQTVVWENNGQQIATVIPILAATLDTATDRVSGTGPANSTLYAAARHWQGRWYSTWSGQTDIAEQVTADAAGVFGANLHCKADLQWGDYAVVHYLDEQHNYHRVYGFTSQPVLTPIQAPTRVRAGDLVRLTWAITEAAHVEYTYVSWWQPETGAHGSTQFLQGGAGHYQALFAAPNVGPITVRTYADVDGQFLRVERTIAITEQVTLAVQDPVHGVTNQAQPVIQGVTAPGVALALYDGQTLLVEGQAGADGFFQLQPTTPLPNGSHEFSVRATVAPTNTLTSDPIQVKIDTTLLVDPMHIYITNRDQRQRIHDARGFADLGGRVWTRSGDTVAIEIPLRCTDVRTADLLVGGVYATSLTSAEDERWIGTYTPPSSGNYAVALQLNCAGVEQRITLLNGLIDPDGYVYWADAGEDRRIAGATVTCYALVEGEWRVWAGYLYGQQNPQSTAADGYYAFFTEPGQYQIRVEAPGFEPYESPVLTVVDEPVHHNAPLVAKTRLYLPTVRR
ncbi:MAG: carboxypeptidase regulatory-like domain-containing protein [Caldilinea sp. CFX5]|nr:carboxypeptidase regulatory-like domain-containing protein [Caldilinea sp. CFX5]